MIGNHLEPFKFWCQKVLPNVYDDSLSYYEYLCKLNEYLNEVIGQINTLTDNMEDYEGDLSAQWETYKTDLNADWVAYKTDLTNQWNTTKNYIDNYFNNLDVQTEINNKLDQMATDGTLDALLLPYFNAYTTEINGIVATQNTKIADIEDDIDTLDSRISAIASLPEGSTTGDAELIDIRTPASGFHNNQAYSSAGDAVRGQVTTVNDEIKSIGQNFSYTISGTSGFATNLQCIVSKGRTYIVTNNTEGSAVFNIINNDGTYTSIKSINGGDSFTWKADNNYKGIRIYFTNTGSCTVVSSDNGIFDTMATKTELALVDSKFETTVGKTDIEINGTDGFATNVYIPIINSRTYYLKNNTSASVNLNVINDNDTYTLIETVSTGATYKFTPTNDYKGIRVYFVATGTCDFESSDNGLYNEINDLLTNQNETRISLEDNKLINGNVILFNTDKEKIYLPKGKQFLIQTIDGSTFTTNSVYMYGSDGTTLINTYNVNQYSGNSRTITNNSGNGYYVALANVSNIGIRIKSIGVEREVIPIRLMQYNIGKFNWGHDGGLSTDVATKISNYKKFLGEYKPNICGIEEYRSYIDTNLDYNTDEVLFNPLYWFKEDTRTESMAVKSDYESTFFEQFYTYSNDGVHTTSGVFTQYDIQIRDKKIAMVVGAIPAGLAYSKRKDGFDNLIARLSSYDNAIILIDSNVLSETEFNEFVSTAQNGGYVVANGGYFGSFNTYNLQSEYYHKIDNILLKGNFKLKNVIVPDVYNDLSSDHYPIIADAELLIN